MNKQPHLLIVDGNPHVITILKQTLKNNFTISTTTSGQDAIRMLAQGNQFDCVVTELNFPRFDGFDLLKAIRNYRLTRHIPILVLTTTPDSITRIKCLDEGADSVLAKPFNPLEVKAKLSAVLRRAEISSQFSAIQPAIVRSVKTQNSFRQLTSKILSFIV